MKTSSTARPIATNQASAITYDTYQIKAGSGDDYVTAPACPGNMMGYVGQVRVRLVEWFFNDRKDEYTAVKLEVYGTVRNGSSIVIMPTSAFECLVVANRTGCYPECAFDLNPWGRQVFASKFSPEALQRLKDIAKGRIDVGLEAVTSGN